MIEIIAYGLFGLLMFCFYMLIRNELVYRMRVKPLHTSMKLRAEAIRESNKKKPSIKKLRGLSEKANKLDEIYESFLSYDRMMLEFWKPLRWYIKPEYIIDWKILVEKCDVCFRFDMDGDD